MRVRCTNCGYEGEAKERAHPVADLFFWLSIAATVISFIVALKT